MLSVVFFFFQAEDGIRDLVRSRGLGDVYKRQTSVRRETRSWRMSAGTISGIGRSFRVCFRGVKRIGLELSAWSGDANPFSRDPVPEPPFGSGPESPTPASRGTPE